MQLASASWGFIGTRGREITTSQEPVRADDTVTAVSATAGMRLSCRFQQFADAPNVIGDTSSHGGCHP